MIEQISDHSRAEVQSFSAARHHKTWRFALPHAQPQATLIWLTRGNARLMMNGRTMGLGAHAVAFVPAGQPFAITPLSTGAGTIVSLPHNIPLPDEAVAQRILDREAQGDLSAEIDALRRAVASTGKTQGRLTLAHGLLISAWLETSVQPPKDLSRAEALSARFVTEVEARFTKAPTLAEIGETLGMTPTHLTRNFRQTAGMTAANYMQDRVMHAARKALADTDDSAAAISRHLGFSSPAYFSRAFTAHSGLAPGQFRAQLHMPLVA